MDTRIRMKACGAALLAALLGNVPWAGAQSVSMNPPLRIGTLAATVDEFGDNLIGSANANAEACDLVQILYATNGIYPPNADGSPNAQNAVMLETRIGSLTSPDLSQPGFFAAAVANPRPPNGEKLFGRVFNATTATGATFYGDSSVATVSSADSILLIARTTNALDSGDADSDGLINSWEKSYGIYVDMKSDTDADGIPDFSEHKAGSDPNDPQSRFLVASVAYSGADALVSWSAAADRQYQVEYTTNDLSQTPVWVTNASAVVTATGTNAQTTIVGAPADALFRVRVVGGYF